MADRPRIQVFDGTNISLEGELFIAQILGKVARMIEISNRNMKDPGAIAGMNNAHHLVMLYSLTFATNHPKHPFANKKPAEVAAMRARLREAAVRVEKAVKALDPEMVVLPEPPAEPPRKAGRGQTNSHRETLLDAFKAQTDKGKPDYDELAKLVPWSRNSLASIISKARIEGDPRAQYHSGRGRKRKTS